MARLVLVIRRPSPPVVVRRDVRMTMHPLDALRIRKRWVIAAFLFGFALAAVLMENQ